MCPLTESQRSSDEGEELHRVAPVIKSMFYLLLREGHGTTSPFEVFVGAAMIDRGLPIKNSINVFAVLFFQLLGPINHRQG